MNFLETYAWTALLSVLGVLVYFGTILNVGRMRMKCNINPPATTGNADFERAFRVQQNTLELLIVFLPTLWLFSMYVNIQTGSILGGIWVLGRIIYAIGYSLDSGKRFPGFGLSIMANIILLFGALVGIIKVIVQ